MTPRQMPLPAAVARPRLTELYRDSGLALAPFLILVQAARAAARQSPRDPQRSAWGTSPATWLTVLEGMIHQTSTR